MKKDAIIQFVCFMTDLPFAEFVTKWDFYAAQFTDSHSQLKLQEQIESKSKFKYISLHESHGKEFEFAFMKGRNSGHFPEHKAKVIQAGGYMAQQIEYPNKNEKGIVKIIAFISHEENDISFYSQLPYRYLNIYQAWYESCLYAYVMEFFVEETQAAGLLSQLKGRYGAEAGLYKESKLPGALKNDMASRKLLLSGITVTEKAVTHH